MDYYQAATYLVVLSAVFGVVNARWLKLPNTIGLMSITLLLTLVLLIIGQFDSRLLERELALVHHIDFETVLLDIMLSFLLFAGAMHTDMNLIRDLKRPIITLATYGVLASTFLVGISAYVILNWFNLDVPILHCLLFGALISPTDPIAVLGVMKQANAPKDLETNIVGESLFNDGVGVVVFVTLLSLTGVESHDPNLWSVVELFGREVVGGLALGACLGWLCVRCINAIESIETEVMLSIACVMGGTALASKLEVSAPLAMVVAGLLMGENYYRGKAEGSINESYLENFWKIVDELLNTLLFVLIGMEVLLLDIQDKFVFLGLVFIPLLWLCRYLSVWLPVYLFSDKNQSVAGTNLVMTWAGLRGGISIALVLSLPATLSGDLFLVITYMIVVVSILGQGLTVGPLIRKLHQSPAETGDPETLSDR